MRVVFLTLGLHPEIMGGAYRFIAEVSAQLAQRGHAVDVICPKPNRELLEEEVRDGIRIHRFENPRGFFFSNWRRENRSAAERLDRVWVQGESLLALCHAYLAPAARRYAAKSIFLFTGPWAEEYLWSRTRPNGFDRIIARALRRTERTALRNAQGILAISEYYRRWLPRWHGEGLAPVHLCPGGVDAAHFTPVRDRRAAREQFGACDKDFIFLALRRLDPRMGLILLLESFAEIERRVPWQLWIAGHGPQEPDLRALAGKLGLEPRVKFLGRIPEEDLPRLWSSADCALMPSLDLEGFGLATLEALACGTPVLGARSGATPELLEPLDPGLLFEPGSQAALRAKLAAVLDGTLRLPQHQQCREYALGFSWDESGRRMEKLLKQIGTVRPTDPARS